MERFVVEPCHNNACPPEYNVVDTQARHPRLRFAAVRLLKDPAIKACGGLNNDSEEMDLYKDKITTLEEDLQEAETFENGI